MVIAERANPVRTPTHEPSAMVAIIGHIDTTAHRLTARLTRLVPTDWQCRQFGHFDQTFGHDGPQTTLILLLCGDNDRFDSASLIGRVSKAGGVPIAVVGEEQRLPPRGACVRAGIVQRIDLGEDEELIDLRLRRAIEQAARQKRLEELERPHGNARARLDGHTVSAVTPAFAGLLGAESTQRLDGLAFDAWLSQSDAARLSAAQTRLLETPNSGGRGLILRRSEAGATRPLSAHLYTGDDQSQWLSLAPLEATSVPLIGRAPVTDARMSLHRHLASINRWAEAGQLRGLIFVAIDSVPALQQQFGLASTDELLEDVGMYLIDRLSHTDRCFRFSVGEYVLSVERPRAEDVTDMARALVRAVGETEFGSRQRSVHVTASISAIMLGQESTSNDRRLQQLAETAYGIRGAGGDGFRECEGDPIADAEPNTDAWQNRLEQALASDRFRLAFQTVTSLAGDHRRYYDVLLRYLDEHDGLVMPANFLPAAEQAGLMPDIDRWVAQRAAQVVADQAARSMEVALFVKVSTATLDQAESFTAWLNAEPSMAPIDRQQLIFCVRESDARSHVAATRRLASGLDEAGFRFALTHFGEASSHAALLENLSLSFLKLAPAFAHQLADQNSEDPRLQRVIDYAREHQVPLVAEHIEDAASMARLWQAGVNYVQGHFIQEPDTAAIH
ncbi:GGDEF domain-containing protein [Salinisphaera sp. SPP-AMP-43]|uniref:EAL domain-containing protein n=1 Tax=Salinisphaera sp. SPP-AMP-43 TaxID=3121288 RepID=UPI003C6E0F53